MAHPRKATHSSMIDLKAELFRKQEEYKQLKAQNSSDYVKGLKTSKPGKGDTLWSKKNAGVLERARRDLSEKEEEDNVMERSRRALEAKSKIYDKIASASGIPDEDGSEGYLVDFQRKAVDKITEQRRGEGKVERGRSAGGESVEGTGQDGLDKDAHSDEPVPLPANPGEDWVDYVDTFGRSRRCMRKDLPDLQKQERPLGRPSGGGGLRLKEGSTLLSADMKRELRHQQWEKEAEESAHGPVHYANVQFDEIRSHGTGFYQFSKDSNIREEQMDMLNKLQQQTMDGRQRSERIKEKRKAALEARLAKVKRRRKMKDGGPMALEDTEEEEIGEGSTPQASADATMKEPEPLTRDDSWRRSAPVREWDIGKEKLPEWNAKRYMEQKRSERESEFAPPQFYFVDQKKTGASATTPSGRNAPHRDTSPHNGTGHGQLTLPGSSEISNMNAMLKQIQHSVGASSHTLESAQQDMKSSRQKENTMHSAAGSTASIDLTSIPLPQVEPVTDSACSEITNQAHQKQEADIISETNKTGDAIDRWVNQQSLFTDVGPGCVQAPPPARNEGHQQQTAVCGPFPDMSLPPTGYPLQPQMLGQQDVMPSPQSTEPPATASAGLCEQGQSSKMSFVYPSQQGLLSSYPQLTSQSNPATQLFASNPVMTKSCVTKATMVDKRFMQNKEVSEEDLLGYMVQTSDDPLTEIQAVSYTPGTFSSAAKTQVSKSTNSGPSVSESEPSSSQVKTTKPAAQTEGVIFGVPDFLQPATMTATSYQPGSFMAAKEAAAQRAEEEYEAARKKTQYFSAPVLYGRSDDSDPRPLEGMNCSEKGTEKEKLSGTQQEVDDADEEFHKFMREVRGGK